MFQNLDSPPRTSDILFWADFIELRAMLHPDKCFTRGDLVSLQNQCVDLNQGFDAQIKWREIINFSELRVNEFGESYPFTISADKDTLSFNNCMKTSQKFYIGLLVSASMRLLINTRRNAIARVFEQICFEVFKALMPIGAEVHENWAGGGSNARYTGSLYEKMKKIANDIRCTANFSSNDFHISNTGDGGIDLIAWHSLMDRREGIPIAFAQCGCSKEDWKFKQLESSWAMHFQKFPVMHPWANYYFLPLDLRRCDGEWAHKSKIGQAIIIDRMRILRISQSFNIFALMPDLAFVEEAMAVTFA